MAAVTLVARGREVSRLGQSPALLSPRYFSNRRIQQTAGTRELLRVVHSVNAGEHQMLLRTLGNQRCRRRALSRLLGLVKPETEGLQALGARTVLRNVLETPIRTRT
jgi:hypothetical protein